MDTVKFYYGLVAVVTLAGLVLTAYRLVLKRLRRKIKLEYQEESERGFIAAMATNHLPHIYEALKQIAEKIEVELKDPPPIEFSAHRER